MTKIFDAGLTPDKQNANEGTQRGRGLLEKSLRKLGAGRSILADRHGNIIAGNKTLEGAAEIDLPVRVIETDGKELVVVKRMDLDLYSETDQRGRKLAYADNKIAELDLSWKPEQIQTDFEPLELDEWGFEFEPVAGDGDAEPQIDRAAELNEKWQVKTGDLWRIGEHRLLCGDSTVREDVERVTSGGVDCTVTDPPYGVGVDYGIFQDTPENVKELIAKIMPIISEHLPAAFTPGIPEMWNYPQPAWVGAWVHPAATSSGPWGFIGANPILYYGKDPYLKANKGRRDTSIVLVADRKNKDDHPVTKPLSVREWLLERMSPFIEEKIFDPFAGSGTTLVACQNLSRKCRAIEISPNYCAVILERMITAFPELTIERIES